MSTAGRYRYYILVLPIYCTTKVLQSSLRSLHPRTLKIRDYDPKQLYMKQFRFGCEKTNKLFFLSLVASKWMIYETDIQVPRWGEIEDSGDNKSTTACWWMASTLPLGTVPHMEEPLPLQRVGIFPVSAILISKHYETIKLSQAVLNEPEIFSEVSNANIQTIRLPRCCKGLGRFLHIALSSIFSSRTVYRLFQRASRLMDSR